MNDNQLEVPQDAPTPTEEAPESYQVESDDDLREVFAQGFQTVTGTADPSSDARVLAHEAGYRLQTVPGTRGWTATRR